MIASDRKTETKGHSSELKKCANKSLSFIKDIKDIA